MSIIINATRSTTYWSYSEMANKLRKQNNEAGKEVALSAKKEETKPVELSKKEEVKVPVALAPEIEEVSVALSPASEPVEVVEEVVPDEAQTQEELDTEAQEELEIVVKSDELLNQPTSIVDIASKDDEMDYNKDGEVTLDERMRYLEEQSKANSLPNFEIENEPNENAFDKIKTSEAKTIEIPEQKPAFDQKQLEGVQKFNYNNLQKAYFAKSQTAQHTITRVA